MAIEINKYKEVSLDLAGVHLSLLGDLLLQVIQQDGTTLYAFSIELVHKYVASTCSYLRSTLLCTLVHCYVCLIMPLQDVRCTMEADILQPNDKPAVLLEATDLQYVKTLNGL